MYSSSENSSLFRLKHSAFLYIYSVFPHAVGGDSSAVWANAVGRHAGKAPSEDHKVPPAFKGYSEGYTGPTYTTNTRPHGEISKWRTTAVKF